MIFVILLIFDQNRKKVLKKCSEYQTLLFLKKTRFLTIFDDFWDPFFDLFFDPETSEKLLIFFNAIFLILEISEKSQKNPFFSRIFRKKRVYL